MANSPAVHKMFSSIAARYDIVNSVLSFGIHHYWKRVLVNSVPADTNSNVLDLCTGTGDLLPLLERRFGRITGADFCEPMLEKSREKYGSRFELVRADAMSLSFANESYDIVSIAFGVRNFEDLQKGLAEIYRVLKKGGSLLILEFGQPRNPIFGAFYKFYSRFIMPLIGGLISGNRQAYEYLPETAGRFPCGGEFVKILEQADFRQCSFRPLTGGIAYCYTAKKET